MSSNPDIPLLTDEEMQELDELLASPVFSDVAMPLDEIQGFLTAIISGPDQIPPSQWMPAIWGEPRFENPSQEQRATALIMKLHNSIVGELEAGQGLHLILAETEDGDCEGWCLAYLDGTDFGPTPWEDVGDAETIDEYLFPISLLAGEIDLDGIKQISKAEKKAFLAECREDLPGIIVDIYQYFKKPKSPSATEKTGPSKSQIH